MALLRQASVERVTMQLPTRSQQTRLRQTASFSPAALRIRADEAVLVVDEGGRFAVSVLAGHEGGANALAKRVAALTGGPAVITTAAEALDALAVALLVQERGWTIATADRVTEVSGAVINGERIGVYQDTGERAWWRRERSRQAQFVLVSALTDLQQEEYRAGLLITARPLRTSRRRSGQRPSCMTVKYWSPASAAYGESAPRKSNRPFGRSVENIL